MKPHLDGGHKRGRVAPGGAQTVDLITTTRP